MSHSVDHWEDLYYDRSKPIGIENSYDFRGKVRGAKIYISEAGGKVYHETENTCVNKPLVRSYKEGLRVGCNFITNDAIELIYKLHKSFLSDQDSRTHQE